MIKVRVSPRCASCFMPLTGWREYHPLMACDLFRRLQNPDAVRRELNGSEAAVDYETRRPLRASDRSLVGAQSKDESEVSGVVGDTK